MNEVFISMKYFAMKLCSIILSVVQVSRYKRPN